MDERVVSVFGTGRARPGERAFELAYELGRMLAEAGFVIANGGYGGTMLAAAKGAREAGGEVIGVTCRAFANSRANAYVSREILTESLEQRLQTLVRLGRAYFVLPGGTGTLLELAMVWELRNKNFLPANRPIILVGQFWQPLVELVAAEDKGAAGYVHLASGPEDALKMLRQK